MPQAQIKPMKKPCPIHSGQGGLKVESARPAPIIKAPQITVQSVPTRSAMRPMRMPPAPEPSQASELASAGIERVPSTSAAISLSATAVIHAEPNAIISVQSAAEATIQDARLSTEEVGCSMQKRPPGRPLFSDCTRFDYCTVLKAAPRPRIGCLPTHELSLVGVRIGH